MKTVFRLRLTAILGSALAATAAFGQVTYTWSGTLSGGNGTNIASTNNWTTNEITLAPAASAPSGASQDTGQWDNLVPGNLVVTYSPAGGLPSTGGGTKGIILELTTNQIGNVQLRAVGGQSGNIGLSTINNLSPSANFILGDDSKNVLNFVMRPPGAVLDLVNNSAGVCVISPNVRWQAGLGYTYTLDFDGTGNWIITNSLANASGPGTLIEKSGSGTMFWNGPSSAGALPNSVIDNPITINAGTMVLQWNYIWLEVVDIVNNGTLEFDAPGQTQILNEVISGTGNLLVDGGTLILNATNTYAGTTTVSNGTLVVSSTAGDLDLSGGNVVPGGANAVGSLLVGGNLNITSGSILIALNKSASPSNSTIAVTGSINNTGGILTVTNAGPNLEVGDTFTIFNQPVSGMTIVPPANVTFINNLAANGSIVVATSTATNPTNILVTLSGGQLILSWPADHLGWYLQAQTNSLAEGIGTNWVTIPNSNAGNSYTNTVGITNGAVFYRMIYP
jgi:autotransporter-associated beta strand protein